MRYHLIWPISLLFGCASVEQCDPAKKNIFLIAACQDKYEVRHNELRQKIAREQELLDANKAENRALLAEIEQLEQEVEAAKKSISQIDIRRDIVLEKHLTASREYSEEELQALSQEVKAVLTETQSALQRNYDNLSAAQNTIVDTAVSEDQDQIGKVKASLLTHLSAIKNELASTNTIQRITLAQYGINVLNLRVKNVRLKAALAAMGYSLTFAKDYLTAAKKTAANQ